jgi:hypothetical protein
MALSKGSLQSAIPGFRLLKAVTSSISSPTPSRPPHAAELRLTPPHSRIPNLSSSTSETYAEEWCAELMITHPTTTSFCHAPYSSALYILIFPLHSSGLLVRNFALLAS